MESIRAMIRRSAGGHPAASFAKRVLFRGSSRYWEERYRAGGTSGVGSYGYLADYKASFLNRFVHDNGVQRIIEFGCGDGNQLSLAEYPEYIGLDVAPTAIERCIERFRSDDTKSFFLYSPRHYSDRSKIFDAELALSLDVIYHLTEDAIFHLYMRHLFQSASRHVVIYSSNDETISSHDPHVRHRTFSTWIERETDGWSLSYHEPNPHCSSQVFAEFFVFSRWSGAGLV